MALDPEDLFELQKHGANLGTFTTNESVKQLFKDLDQLYWQQAKTATTPAARDEIVAKARALGDLWNAMAEVVEMAALRTAEAEAGALSTQQD